MQKKIEIIEVGTRDGFQSVACTQIPTKRKLEIIDQIIAAGVQHMEYTSFVSPKAIPQLADAAEVTSYILEAYPDLDAFALVPNLRGAENAYSLGLRKVVYVVSLSASHNKSNISRSHEQSLDAYKEIKQSYPDLDIIVDLATAFGCPFEGKYIEPDRIKSFVGEYIKEGMQCCCLCDTIGIADPRQTELIVSSLQKEFPGLELMVHFHDTRGLGMVNTVTAIHMGIDKVQSALGGLGGCPFAPGASGNLATEDLQWMLNEMGYTTGISFEKLLSAAKYQRKAIQGDYSGHQIHIGD